MLKYVFLFYNGVPPMPPLSDFCQDYLNRTMQPAVPFTLAMPTTTRIFGKAK